MISFWWKANAYNNRIEYYYFFKGKSWELPIQVLNYKSLMLPVITKI